MVRPLTYSEGFFPSCFPHYISRLHIIARDFQMLPPNSPSPAPGTKSHRLNPSHINHIPIFMILVQSLSQLLTEYESSLSSGFSVKSTNLFFLQSPEEKEWIFFTRHLLCARFEKSYFKILFICHKITWKSRHHYLLSLSCNRPWRQKLFLSFWREGKYAHSYAYM